MLLAALALAAIMLLTSLFIGSGTRKSSGEPAGGVLNLLRDRSVRGAVITSGIVMAVVDITVIYLPALGRESGLTAAFIGTVLAVRAVSSMAVRLVTGWVVRVFGRRPVLVVGMLMSAVALVAAAVWPLPVVLVVSAVVLGTGLGWPNRSPWPRWPTAHRWVGGARQ